MEYVIKLINETSDESPVKGVTGKSESVGGETGAGATKGEQYAMKMAKRLVSVGAVSHTINQVVSHQHSTISLRTGAQEYSQRANYIYQKGSSFIQSVVMGAVAGSGAGLPGVAIGAAFGALTNIGGNAMNYFFKQDVLQKEKQLEDISRRMQMMRATTSGRRYSNITEF